VADDVRVVALGEDDPNVVVGSSAVSRPGLLPAAGVGGGGTWARQRLAGNPVTVSIKTVRVAARTAMAEEEVLRVRLGGKLLQL
jgi:hypothetical protein